MGMRLLVLVGDVIISFDADRGIDVVEFVTVAVDVGVSVRVQGSDPCVLVLLKEDVDPPVDVD